LLAIQVPVVGWTPLKSLEQLSAFGVFLVYQMLQLCEIIIKKQQLKQKNAWKLRFKVISVVMLVGIAALVLFTPTGYFGPISSRVRGLFVKHTKTGNPLVDSVAEHQPARANSYFQYLHHFCSIAPLGFIMVMIHFGDSPSFVAAYGVTAYFFSHRMVRLILLLAPVTSILGGIAFGRIISWSIDQFLTGDNQSEKPKRGIKEEKVFNEGKKKKKSKKNSTNGGTADKKKKVEKDDMEVLEEMAVSKTDDTNLRWTKRVVASTFTILMLLIFKSFHTYSWTLAKHLSNPSIIQVGQKKSGETVVVDDYREAYNWIRLNTPEDARIMAWWDYGYQITEIANRTTIADGNTWNHEHIALLARILTGPADEGHKIARHLADYVLVWSGGGGDDVAKSPHLARIANSVYRDMCSDPVCSQFGLVSNPTSRSREPSAQMKRSLVYTLVRNGVSEGVSADPSKFSEVWRTKYGKVRIYKINGVDEESKKWAADPKNRDCDVEGGWYCRGRYPPALYPYVKEGKDFIQLEDFNKKEDDSEYQKQYLEKLGKLKRPADNKLKRPTKKEF